MSLILEKNKYIG